MVLQYCKDENLSHAVVRWGPFVPPEMTKRDVPGFAIGGLSGGESKAQFWKMVALSTSKLPKDKPRYLMGVGYVEGSKPKPCPPCMGGEPRRT